MRVFIRSVVLLSLVTFLIGDVTYGASSNSPLTGAPFGKVERTQKLQYEWTTGRVNKKHHYAIVGDLWARKYYRYEAGGLETSLLKSYAGSGFSFYVSDIPESIPNFNFQVAVRIRGTGHEGHRSTSTASYERVKGKQRIQVTADRVAYAFNPNQKKLISKSTNLLGGHAGNAANFWSAGYSAGWKKYISFTYQPEQFTHELSPYAEADISVTRGSYHITPSSPRVHTQGTAQQNNQGNNQGTTNNNQGAPPPTPTPIPPPPPPVTCAGCGVSYPSNNQGNHYQMGSCNETNGNGDRCTNSNMWVCQHTHMFPPHHPPAEAPPVVS